MFTGILSMSIAGNGCKQNYKQTTPSMAIENHKSMAMAKLIARRACALHLHRPIHKLVWPAHFQGEQPIRGCGQIQTVPQAMSYPTTCKIWPLNELSYKIMQNILSILVPLTKWTLHDEIWAIPGFTKKAKAESHLSSEMFQWHLWLS